MIRTPHSATYTRVSSKNVDRKRVRVDTPPKPFRCLFEPLPAKWKSAISARIPSASGVISWRHPLVLADGDKVEFQGRTYYLNEVIEDIHRGRWPYYTAIGSEQYHA